MVLFLLPRVKIILYAIIISVSTVFENIYKTNYQKLYTLAFRMTGSREDSEDILQTSFLNAYKAFPSFRNESSAYTWLYRIVMNAANKYHRERKKLPAEEYAENNNISINEFYRYINSYGTVEDEVLINLTRESCLQMFMNCMPAVYRAVYTLRIMLNFSVKNTAKILDISESSVKVNLHRARNAAKNHIEGRCSLIQAGAMCDCRSYAGYLAKTGRAGKLCSIETVRNKEKAAVEKYNSEIKILKEIDSLYNNQIKPPDYENFIREIRKLLKEKKLTLLDI